MDVHLLGPVQVTRDGRPLALGTPKARALLALLALRPGETVTTDRIVEGLWAEDPPASARKLVQHYVSQLRRTVGDAIVTRGRGYQLALAPEAVDVVRFERLVEGGDPDGALRLWRGTPLADLADEPFAAAEVRRLEELRLRATELALDRDVEHGRHEAAIPALERLVAEHPYRERLHALRMLALYRSGRQAEALDAFTAARRTLVEAIGIEPGPELQCLQQAALAQDPALATPQRTEPAVGRPPAARPAGRRRLVTIVSVGLDPPPAPQDPEVALAQLDATRRRLEEVVGRHGGTVERVEADAATAAFGLADLHEDDALRAARAAIELRGLPGVLRLGIEAGTVFAADAAATGPPLERAAALRHVAAPGHVVVGAGARALLGAAAVLEDSKAGAWRLDRLRTDAPAPSGPFVGRERELAALAGAVDEARASAACRLVPLVGPPGIGKSRLVRELAAREAGAIRLRVGRCPGYGETRTYRPVAELLGDFDDAGRPEEVALSARRGLEALARDRPLVAAIEDVHGAQPPLLDLLDYVAAFSTGAPVVLLATARPELLDLRPGWAAPQPGRTLMALGPLTDDDAHCLAAAATGDAERRTRVVAAAEGNPLFLEQLLAVDDDVGLPPSLHAVLAARLDRLDPGERDVLERAAVAGRTFPVALVEALADRAGEPLIAWLLALVRAQLIRLDRPGPDGADTFRFAHALIREAAYEGLPRRRRSVLHEDAAAWLEARGAEAEAVAHQLEQAHHEHLTPEDERGRRLAGEAAAVLERAGASALGRGDAGAGARLLERAVALDADGERTLLLGTALREAGRLGEAASVLARAADDPRLRAHATVERWLVRLHGDPTADLGDARRAAVDAIRELTRHDDDLGLSRALGLLAWTKWTEGRAAAADAAWRQAAAFGPMPVPEAIRRCEGIRQQVTASPVTHAVVLRPLALLHALGGDVATARRLLVEANAALDQLGRMHSGVSHHEAQVELLAGEPGRAERRLRADYERLAALAERPLLATTAAMLAQALLMQNRLVEAEKLCTTSAEVADPGDHGTQALWRSVRARVLARRGDDARAEPLAREAVALVERTDCLTDQGDALLALAEVLGAAGDAAAADAAREEARRRYDRKGAVI